MYCFLLYPFVHKLPHGNYQFIVISLCERGIVSPYKLYEDLHGGIEMSKDVVVLSSALVIAEASSVLKGSCCSCPLKLLC